MTRADSGWSCAAVVASSVRYAKRSMGGSFDVVALIFPRSALTLIAVGSVEDAAGAYRGEGQKINTCDVVLINYAGSLTAIVLK